MSIAAWAAGAAVAIGVAALAVSRIEDGLGAGNPRSPAADLDDVRESPATPAETPASKGGQSPSVSETTIERVLSSPGGTVVARCRGAQVYLASWSPAQGYRADDVRRGPAVEARVKFESAAGEFVVDVRCVSGVPHHTIERDDH